MSMRFWAALTLSGPIPGIEALRSDGPGQQQGQSARPDPALHPDRQYGGQARAATYRRAFLILAWITGAILTLPVSAAAQGVCDRTPQVRDKLLEITKVSSCESVTQRDLDEVAFRGLYLGGAGIASLRVGDFDGLGSLTVLSLHDNQLSSLPKGIFRGLSSLERLFLDDNELSALPDDIFVELGALQYLGMSGNRLSTLPVEVFGGTSTLQNLGLGDNRLSGLPEDIFRGLSSLEQLHLHNNQLAELPEEIFRGLDRLSQLWLHGNRLTALPEGVFHGLDNLASAVVARQPTWLPCPRPSFAGWDP